MNDMQALFQSMFRDRLPTDEEYRNEADGLIYCRKCHTPRQAMIFPRGCDKPFTPPVMCRCQSDKLKREEERRLQQQFEHDVKRMRADGLQDRALLNYTFANDKGYTPQIDVAQRYVDHFEELEKKGTGLLLWGKVGSGKTYLAGCIANALLDKRIPVLMTNFSRVLNRLASKVTDDWNALLDSFDQYRLLIFDDLGAERNSEFALEQIFHVVDTRCQSNRPMIITTNLTVHDMKSTTDLARLRIYDRIFERCVPIRVTGKGIRSHIADDTMEEVRNMLGCQ